MEFPQDKYDIIYADPSWAYYKASHTFSGNRRTSGAITHYPTMNLDELKRLPVSSICEKNCLLFMWTTSPQMKRAIELGEAWGFQYVTVAFVWDKSIPVVGHYTMSTVEYVLLFKRGTIPKNRGTRNERQFLSQKKTRHSEKPSEIRDRITRMFPTHKKIELFARQRVDGWSCWGNDPNIMEDQTSVTVDIKNIMR